MNFLVTGSAGFIGFHLVQRLVCTGNDVIGIDNINDYYSVDLKYDRLANLGICKSEVVNNKIIQSSVWSNFKFSKIDIDDLESMNELFKNNKIDIVINLAAQAGVRFSINNPRLYVKTNVNGFFNLIEISNHWKVKKFLYASSSSVYGITDKEVLRLTDKVDAPASLYAATKKSNELFAHVYSHLHNLNTIGLRLFTVYGPWGRPDMSPFLFTDSIYRGIEINVNNFGRMKRDFTYIDDTIDGITQLIFAEDLYGYNIFNIGNSQPVDLLDFIRCIEDELGILSVKKMLPMQPGDVVSTCADISQLNNLTGYSPSTSIEVGIKKYVKWYKDYYVR